MGDTNGWGEWSKHVLTELERLNVTSTALDQKIRCIQENIVSLDYIKISLTELKDSVKLLRQQINEQYVTKMEFEPVKKLVYGLVGVVMVAVVGALLALVIKG